MSNVYKTRELMTIARNADNSITCCLVWYRHSAAEYIVFSPATADNPGIERFATQHKAMERFEELTA